MKTLLLALVLSAVPASAQDFTGLVATTKATLQTRGENLSGACGAAKITVRVAYALKDQGYGLLVKRAGNRAVFLADGSCVSGDDTSAPGFATDYLIQSATGFGYDCLQDGGGANGPQWMGPESDAEMVQRNRANFALAPNLDGVTMPNPIIFPPGAPSNPALPQPPGTGPVPVPEPTPTPTIDYSEVLKQILMTQQQTLASQAELLTIAQDTNTHVKNMDQTLTQTLGHVSAFLGKYVAPAVAAWFAARQLDSQK